MTDSISTSTEGTTEGTSNEGTSNEGSTALTAIDNLPDSVLLHIFSFLGYETLCLGVRMTCQRWHVVSQDAELWQHMDIPEHFSDERFLLVLEQVRDHVEGLECCKAENLSEKAFMDMADMKFPKLKTLGMPIINRYSDKVFEKLVQACPVLEELENVNANVDDTCHPLLCQSKFPTLKIVHDRPILSYGRIRKAAPNLGAQKRRNWLEDLQDLSAACPNIDGYRCRRAMDFMDNEAFESLCSLFPNLLFLELNYTTLTDDGIAKFFKENKSSLKELILDKAGELSDASLRIIGDHCPNLSIFKICRTTAITSEGVTYLVEKCTKLQELHLNNSVYLADESMAKKAQFTNGCVYHISRACPDLTFFRLFYSNAVNQMGIWALTEHSLKLQGLMFYECPEIDDACLRAMSHMKRLKSLVISNASSEGKITPKGMIDFVLQAPSLTRLTFFTSLTTFKDDMSSLAEEIYEQLDDQRYHPSVLKSITLRGVGGAFLQLLTVLCPELHTLDMREANLVGPNSLSIVVRNCENLRVLDVQNVVQLDDTFLRTVVSQGTNLRRLGLGSNVKFLSNKCLADVMETCPSLTSVSMDTYETSVDEEMLITSVKKHHGGHCVFHVDPDCRKPDPTFLHRLVEFHFTPIKYLASVRHSTAAPSLTALDQ